MGPVAAEPVASESIADVPAGRDLLGQVAWYIPSALVPAGMALLSASVFTRMFNALDYGRFALALSVAGFVSAFSYQWLQQGLTRFLPGERDATRRRTLHGAAVRGIAWIWVGLAAGAAVTATVMIAIGSAWARWIAPAALVAAGAASFNFIGAVLQSAMQARRYTVYRIAEAVLRFGFAFTLVMMASRDALFLAWGSALSVLSVIPFMWRTAALPLPRLAGTAEERTALRSLLSYGVPMVGWYLAALLLDVGDRLLIEWLRGTAEVGLYSANYNLIYGAISLLAAPMLLAAHPFLMSAWAGGHADVAGRWLGRIAEWYIVAGTLATGATWLAGRDAAALFLGAEFRPGSVILAPLVAGLVIWQLGMYLHKPLEFAGRTREMFAIALAVTLLKVALNLLLIPRYGYPVVAWTSVAAFAAYSTITLVRGRRTLRWHMDLMRIARVAVPVLGLCWLARDWPLPARVALIAALGLGVLWAEWRIIRPTAA